MPVIMCDNFSHMRAWKIQYAFLEYLAYWEGRVTGARLGQLLGRTREHVQREILTPYRREFGERLELLAERIDPDADRPHVQPEFAPVAPGALIDIVRGEARFAEAAGESPRFGIPVEDVTAIGFREPHAQYFRMLHRACVQRHAVPIEYVSKRRTAAVWFSPHTLVRDFARAHFRGYASWSDHKPGFYIDLVPSRIFRVLGAGDATRFVSGDADRYWNQRVTLTFNLNPGIPEGIREILRLEHNEDRSRMEFKRLIVPDVRLALRLYVERALRYRFFDDSLQEVWIPDGEKSL